MIYAHPEERKCSRGFPNRANGIRGYGSIFEAARASLSTHAVSGCFRHLNFFFHKPPRE